MKRQVYAFCVSFVSLFPVQTQSQQLIQSVAVQRDPQALALLSQCSSAMGVSSPIPDLYVTGTMTPVNPDSAPSSFVLKSKGTDRIRTEFNSATGLKVFVVNNGQGFSLIAGARKSSALHSTEYFRPEHLSAFACSIDLARPNVGVSYVGLESLGSSTAHHLVFRAASPDPLEEVISEFHVYLDPQTLRVVKTANWVFAPNAVENRSLWETYYDSYQPIAGVLFPMHISHFIAGSKLDDWNFTSVQSDVPVADGDFN
jgi:hypothetical protein